MFTAGVLFIAVFVFAALDAWAPAVNTLLIIALALYNARSRRKLQHDVRDAKRAAGAARRDDPRKPDTGARRRWDD